MADMDLRKLVLFLERLLSLLCAKGRIISGFGLGLMASLFLVSLLLSMGGNSGPVTVDFVPSALSRIFPSPGNSSLTSALPSSWLGWRRRDVGNMADGDGAVPGRRERVRENNRDTSLSRGDRVGSAGELGLAGGSDGNDTGPDAHLGRFSVSESPENGTVESSVLKQGEAVESFRKGNSTNNGMGNKGGFLKSGSPEKLNQNKSSADFMGKSKIAGEELDTANANVSVQDNYRSLSPASSLREKTNKTGSLGDSVRKANRTILFHEANRTTSSGSRSKNSGLHEKCDIFDGRWVRDETRPLYPPGSCPYVDSHFNCHNNGRPDSEFLRWRWQPNDCEIPRLNATDFLMRLRGQRLIFVGDSLNRNMWESLVCILRHGIGRKSRVYEMSGRNQFKTSGYYSFIFEAFNCSLDFIRSPFLVRELYPRGEDGLEDEKLRLDAMDATTAAYREADIVVFNTGHWWTHEKTSKGINYYQEGGHVYPILKVMEAYKKALSTWAKWVDENIDHNKTQVFFRGFSLTHFSGGQWNSGGQCHKETEPIFNQDFLRDYPEKMLALEKTLKQMKTPVVFLNISRMTDYRKDGHPSIYRKKYSSVGDQINAEKVQDCSHWCLPGVPDAWNELLYASLLMVGRGPWRN